MCVWGSKGSQDPVLVAEGLYVPNVSHAETRSLKASMAKVGPEHKWGQATCDLEQDNKTAGQFKLWGVITLSLEGKDPHNHHDFKGQDESLLVISPL